MDGLSIFSFFKSLMWDSLQKLFATSLFISIMACILTQAIKIVWTRINPDRKTASILINIVNAIFCFLGSFLIIIVFDKINSENFILYLVYLSFVSWAFSVLAYDSLVKYVFSFLEILDYQISAFREVSKNKYQLAKSGLKENAIDEHIKNIMLNDSLNKKEIS